MIEKNSGQVTINDMSALGVEKMLQYFYSGTVDVGKNVDLVEELLYASEKYLVPGLRDAVCQKIM